MGNWNCPRSHSWLMAELGTEWRPPGFPQLVPGTIRFHRVGRKEQRRWLLWRPGAIMGQASVS